MTSVELVVLRGVLAEQLGRIQREPGIDAAGLDARGHLQQQLLRARMQRGALLVHRTAPAARPQVRWREMHQSGRFSIMLVMRCSPHAGVQRTCLMSRSACARSPR